MGSLAVATDDTPTIQELYEDLVAATESRLRNINALSLSLEANIDSLKQLLDKKPRNDQSKAALASG